MSTRPRRTGYGILSEGDYEPWRWPLGADDVNDVRCAAGAYIWGQSKSQSSLSPVSTPDGLNSSGVPSSSSSNSPTMAKFGVGVVMRVPNFLSHSNNESQAPSGSIVSGNPYLMKGSEKKSMACLIGQGSSWRWRLHSLARLGWRLLCRLVLYKNIYQLPPAAISSNGVLQMPEPFRSLDMQFCSQANLRRKEKVCQSSYVLL